MMKIGFVGTGNFATQHAKILCALGSTITACYGTNLDKTLLFSENFKCKVYDDPLEFISKDIIDVLYIVIPPYAHNGKIEIKSIEENIPFFCEKPIGLNISICDKIAKLVKQKNLITSVGYLLRYEPLFDEIKKIICRNIISTVRICCYSYMPEVHWWRKKDLSGGMMIESGIHYIDLLRYLFGKITYASAVVAEGIAKKNVKDCDSYDSMEALLKFDSGIIGSIGVTHLLNKINARNDLLEVYGQNFALKVDLYKLRYKNEAAVIYKEENDDNWNTISYHSDKKLLMLRESERFLSAVQCGDPSLILSDYNDALQSLKIACAMGESADTGMPIII